MILHYLNQDFVEKKRDKLFSLDYETRPNSKAFLQNPEEDSYSCIDFYFMHQAYATIEKWFRFFNARLAGKSEEEMKKNWEEVQGYYQRFNEWFHDRELYHKIGFLLTAEIADIKELYNQSSNLKKSESVSYINNVIRKHYKSRTLLELSYESKETKSVLLLYNILTMLQNEHDASYFPFNDYKLNKWDVEHIASRKDARSVPAANREKWLLDVKCYIDEEQEDGPILIQDIDSMLASQKFENDDDFTLLYGRVTLHFNKYMDSGEDADEISNLALLDEKTNRGYKNAVFPLKRKYIIELDKTGGFVPICTKNAFLKYFSDYPPKISFWTQDDREKYEQDLIRVLSPYMEVTK